MPQGYYTIEWWTAADGAPGRWGVVLQLPFGATLTAPESALEKLGNAGFFRIVQMQRVIWAEKQAGGLRLRKSEAGLDRILQMFELCGGVYPAAEVRAHRQKVKQTVPGRRCVEVKIRPPRCGDWTAVGFHTVRSGEDVTAGGGTRSNG